MRNAGAANRSGFGTAGKNIGNDYGAHGLPFGPHFAIRSLGCGYYEVQTRADVWGIAVSIHSSHTPMGTSLGECRVIAKNAERKLQKLVVEQDV